MEHMEQSINPISAQCLNTNGTHNDIFFCKRLSVPAVFAVCGALSFTYQLFLDTTGKNWKPDPYFEPEPCT